MTDDLYERYKEALRVGHVSVLRGSLNAAVDAYRTASDIAPTRALPHTSLGGVLLRLGRLEEALVEYAAAVARAPHDEGALLGQAEALSIAGQRVDAAAALDQVAEIQAESGRLPEAADTLRRAIEFSETESRARRQRELLRQIRLSAGDQAAEQLLARALRLRDDVADGSRHAAATPAPAPDWIAAPIPIVADAMPAPDAAAEPAEEDEPAEIVAEATGEVEPVEAVGQSAQDEEPAADVVEADEDELAGALAFEAVSENDRPVGDSSRPTAWDSWWGEESRKTETTEEPAAAATGVPAETEPAADVKVAATPAQPFEEAPAAAVEAVVEAAGFAFAPGESRPAPSPVPEELRPAATLASHEEAPAEVQFVGVMEVPADGSLPADSNAPSGDELLAAAEAADLAGNAGTLRSLLLWTARAYAREGRFEAALDAAHRLLKAAPSDVDTHLVLVELYMARDWNALAAEKLALLERLAVLSGDEDTRKRVCTVASRAFPRDERLGALCS